MFDYKKRANAITIGYRINDTYWNQGIAINVIEIMVKYLLEEVGINTIKAFVMPENVYLPKMYEKCRATY